jgi:hypothetical protein
MLPAGAPGSGYHAVSFSRPTAMTTAYDFSFRDLDGQPQLARTRASRCCW